MLQNPKGKTLRSLSKGTAQTAVQHAPTIQIVANIAAHHYSINDKNDKASRLACSQTHAPVVRNNTIPCHKQYTKVSY